MKKERTKARRENKEMKKADLGGAKPPNFAFQPKWLQKAELHPCCFLLALRHCKVLSMPRKISARSYKVPANLKIRCSTMQPFSRNQRPNLLTSLTNTSLVQPLPGDMQVSRSPSNVPRLPWFFGNAAKPSPFSQLLARCRIPCACQAKPHLNLRKWSKHVFNILTSKCALCQKGVHFFDTQLPQRART